jgi:hypothetical protein
MRATTFNRLKKKANQLTNNFLPKAQKRLLGDMTKWAKDGDRELAVMSANDLADIMYVCHAVKNGNYIEAHNYWWDMDTDPRDMFPNTLIDILDRLSDYEQDHNADVDEEED